MNIYTRTDTYLYIHIHCVATQVCFCVCLLFILNHMTLHAHADLQTSLKALLWKILPTLPDREKPRVSSSFPCLCLPTSCLAAHRIRTAQVVWRWWIRLQGEPRGLRCVHCPRQAAELCLRSWGWHSTYTENAKASTSWIRRGKISCAAKLKTQEVLRTMSNSACLYPSEWHPLQ